MAIIQTIGPYSAKHAHRLMKTLTGHGAVVRASKGELGWYVTIRFPQQEGVTP